MIPRLSRSVPPMFLPNEKFRLSPIKQIEIAASRIPGVVSLAQGIPSFQTPAAIREFVWEKIQSGACDKYSLSPGLEELREELSLSLSLEGLSYDPDGEILVTAGSIEGVTATLLALAQPGDEVLLPSPTYASYLGAIYAARCVPRYVPLDEENNFDFLPEEVEKAITKRTKVFLFCTPNNPTGTLFSKEKSEMILEIAERHNLLLLVDEVYKDFYYTGEKHVSPAALSGGRERVIRACSFSKAYAMTGWRVGFLLGQRECISEILKYHDVMVSCAPVVSQYAAIAALRHGEDVLNGFQTEYKRRRDYTLNTLERLSEWVDFQTPKATYFAFPRLKDTVPLARDSERLAYDILEKARVAFVPGIAFGPTGESHLRINYGRSYEDLQIGLERFGNYLSEQTLSSRWKQKNGEFRQASTPPSRSSRSKFLSTVLQFFARWVIARDNPTVIGIAGIQSKTTWKRLLVSLLSQRFDTVATPFSYNTPIGLPLGVLGLQAPKGVRDKLTLPFRLVQSAFSRNLKNKVVILEFGPASRDEAVELLSVCKPEWLLVTGTQTAEPNIDRPALRDAITQLIRGVGVERVLYRGDDQALRELVPDLLVSNELRLSDISPSEINGTKSRYRVNGEFVGDGASLGALAAVRVAEALNLEESEIVQFLSLSL
ncbi:MAG: aminotransferase class I/II-fold pyridoxal phosphate-dependent enzyme [Bdellovibrionales bacterium]|nr:aminotransferase class I/II-fold pyridoxal phosphate-dependent enzyme [Bdellovibrionales bacterium]